MNETTVLNSGRDGKIELSFALINGFGQYHDMKSRETIKCLNKINLDNLIKLVKFHLSSIVDDKPCYYTTMRQKRDEVLRDEYINDTSNSKLIEDTIANIRKIDVNVKVSKIEVCFEIINDEYIVNEILLFPESNAVVILVAYRKDINDHILSNNIFSEKDLILDALRNRVENTISINNQKMDVLRKINNNLNDVIIAVESERYKNSETNTI